MFKILYDKDNGISALRKKFGKKVVAKIGIQGKKNYEPLRGKSDFSMVDLGLVHEYGSKKANVPQRSFMRSTFDENETKYENRLKRTARKIAKNPKTSNLAEDVFLLGEKVRKDIIKKINSNIPPPLADSTVEKKKDDLALVDKGLMIGAISSVVEHGKSK